jgi:single-strand DNA-binding protein
MLNRFVCTGRLVRDPEQRFTASGVAVTSFTVAVQRNYKNAQGEYESDFIDITVWRGLAESCANYIRKGSLVGLEGRIQNNNYENQEGKTIYKTGIMADNVTFLDSKKNDNSEQPADNSDPFQGVGKPIDIDDGSLPF